MQNEHQGANKMKSIVSPTTMAYLDKVAIDGGVSSKELMFRAANSISKHLNKYKDILIATGPGNNGGDGFALASLLYKQGKNVSIFLVSEPKSEDAIYYYEKLKKDGFDNFVETIKDSYDAVVDCIFGNGLDRVLSSKHQNIINVLNKCNAYKIAVDIPTGISGLNGVVMGNAFIADKTIVIAAYKFGHFLQDAKDYVGKMFVEDIGIPITQEDALLIEESDVKEIFPFRKQNANKYSFGRACVIGGSSKYKGAPVLSMLSTAALRVGAGLSYIAYPKSIENTILTHVVDEIYMPIEDNNGLIIFDKKALDKIMATSDVIAFGMGIGRSEEIEKTLKYILENFEKTVIVDADGITAFTAIYQDIKILSKVILTPHLGEAVRLFLEEKDTILANRVNITTSFAKRNNVIVLLKGPTTIVSNGNETFFINKGSVALAKAGTGDVLSGVIAGIEAYNKDPISSAYAASYVTGLAATKAEKEYGQYGVLASDLPKIIKELQDKD